MNFHHVVNGHDTLESDVLIVGSGLIGAVYTRALIDANKDISVLMVDIGAQGTRLIGDHKKNSVVVQKDMSRFTSTIQGQWSLLSEPVNTTTALINPISSPTYSEFVLNNQNAKQSPYTNLPAAPVIREVGGMGSYWSCSTPEQHPEIERSDIFSDVEWKELYDKARALFHTTNTAFDNSIRQQLVKDTLLQANKNREFVGLPLACQRSTRNPEYVQWTSTATILGELADPKYSGGNFELKTQHCCTKLFVDAASRQAVGAQLKNLLTNEIVLAKAKKYVICAGAVLTAGILFNSQIRPDNGYPALGRYMTEQTVAFCQVVLKKSLIESVWDDPRCKEHFKKVTSDPLRIPYNDPDPQITTPLSKEHPWHTQIHRDAFNYGAVPTSIDQRLVLDLRFFGYVKPVYGNYVEFSSEMTDIFGMPQPTFHYRIGKQDAERAEAMMKDMTKLAFDLGSFLPGSEPKFLAPGAALHICGTTRAGKEDDGHSVVDKHSKVWRLDNLFVGGCGVIPTQNACNPTLTAACFALVGARKIVEELAEMRSLQ